jgi:hypothetical protein
MYNTDIPQRADLPSSAQLLRSTCIAATVAAALLVTMVLPAEYGIDPTGVGRALGLTQMADVKKAQTTQAAPASATAPSPQSVSPTNASTSALPIAATLTTPRFASTRTNTPQHCGHVSHPLNRRHSARARHHHHPGQRPSR